MEPKKIVGIQLVCVLVLRLLEALCWPQWRGVRGVG